MIAHVNDELCEQTDSGMFVSLLYAHLNTRTGEVEFCNAGHPIPYLLGADHSTRPLTGAKDVASGAMSALDYHVTTVQLTPGDTLFFYTRRRHRGAGPQRPLLLECAAGMVCSTTSARYGSKKLRAEWCATCELSAVNVNKVTIFP